MGFPAQTRYPFVVLSSFGLHSIYWFVKKYNLASRIIYVRTAIRRIMMIIIMQRRDDGYTSFLLCEGVRLCGCARSDNILMRFLRFSRAEQRFLDHFLRSRFAPLVLA